MKNQFSTSIVIETDASLSNDDSISFIPETQDQNETVGKINDQKSFNKLEENDNSSFEMDQMIMEESQESETTNEIKKNTAFGGLINLESNNLESRETEEQSEVLKVLAEQLQTENVTISLLDDSVISIDQSTASGTADESQNDNQQEFNDSTNEDQTLRKSKIFENVKQHTIDQEISNSDNSSIVESNSTTISSESIANAINTELSKQMIENEIIDLEKSIQSINDSLNGSTNTIDSSEAEMSSSVKDTINLVVQNKSLTKNVDLPLLESENVKEYPRSKRLGLANESRNISDRLNKSEAGIMAIPDLIINDVHDQSVDSIQLSDYDTIDNNTNVIMDQENRGNTN